VESLMRYVNPTVYGPIARPQLNWDEIRRYLDDVGGTSWADRVEGNATDGDALVEFMGRLCYRSWEPGLNPNVSKVREDSKAYLGNVLSSGHGSVTEHANYSFVLHNVSRVLTHELVRHRAGVGISQESMRYVRLDDLPFWMPDWAMADAELAQRSVYLLQLLEEHQRWMAEHFGLDDDGVPFSEKKHKTSFMRRFAPDGVATSIGVTINVRALRHIVYMRTSLAAEEEIRIVFDEVAQLALEAIPNLMQDYSPNEDREWIPDFLKV
jgi:thymidylate synthase (FAD)